MAFNLYEASRDTGIFRPFRNAQGNDTFVMLGPIIPMKAMAITMFGNPSTKSIKRDSQRSIRGVENPAKPPMTIPMAPGPCNANDGESNP